jgi:hypothetical protein
MDRQIFDAKTCKGRIRSRTVALESDRQVGVTMPWRVIARRYGRSDDALESEVDLMFILLLSAHLVLLIRWKLPRKLN